jgi:protein TonB
MFEQSTLPRGSTLKRFLTTSLGMTGQAMLVGCMLLAPMVWPQILPKAMVMMTIAPPGPPPPKPASGPTVRSRATRVSNTRTLTFHEPNSIPPHAATIIQAAPVAESGPGGVVGSVPGAGSSDGVVGSVLGDIMRQGAPPPVTLARAPDPPRAAPAPATQPKRIRVSQMQMARLIHRVEPVYPPLAKSARIFGTVQLEGVIGTDGRLRELRVLSGHPFLSRAALDAVSQWVYEPTILNGGAVEVIAPITVTFILN